MFSPYNIYFLHQSHNWASEITFCFHDLTLQNHLKSNYNVAIFRESLNFLNRTQTCLDLHLGCLHFKWSSLQNYKEIASVAFLYNLETKLVFEIATYLGKKNFFNRVTILPARKVPRDICGRTWYILFHNIYLLSITILLFNSIFNCEAYTISYR